MSKPSQEPDLVLRPQLKIKRLNRLAILLAAGAGILVLWIAYFALSTQPRLTDSNPFRPSATPAEKAALERLEELARQPEPQQTPRRAIRPARPNSTAPPLDSEQLRERQQLLRAQDAAVLAAGFVSRPAEDRQPAVAAPSTARRPLPDDAARLQSRPPERTLQAGTLIPAVLTTGIHSDLPGQTTALVRQDVYDSRTGRHLLIPQGAELVGTYEHEVAWGQKRLLVHWNRLYFPGGHSLDLDDYPAVGPDGMSGLRDRVHNHYPRIFGTALLLSAIGAGTQLSQPQESADGGAPHARQIGAGAVGQELGRAATELLRKNLDVQPTLEVRPGTLFHIAVAADLAL